jgi:FKBP-type peptidyl-prolyl cis-trans isomerase FklB
MNRIFVAVLVSCMTTLSPVSAEEKPAMTAQQKLAYSLGADLGKTFRQQGVMVDAQAFGRGFADALAGGALAMTAEEMTATIQAFQQEMVAKQQEYMQAQAAANKKAADAFFQANKGKPGVTTLPSGLQYKVLTEGTGPTPTATDTVTVHYRGMLLDGTEFDSSYARGEPASLPVNSVIKGWTEALQLMKVGSKWQLFIPPELAYGERGAGRVIAPNQGLVFEVELLGIQPH